MTLQRLPNADLFTANGLPTLIGSVPMDDHAEALKLIMTHTPQIPLWPQLPCRPQERMLVQYNEGIPGVSETPDKTFYDTGTESFESDMLAFFEDYLTVNENISLLDDSRFAISRDRAPGLYVLLETLRDKADVIAVKGQTTGPFTLLTGIHDTNKRLGYYDPTIREIMVKGSAMKAAWQTRMLQKSGRPAIVFIDEPALAGLGSSQFISISHADISADLNEVAGAIQQQGGLAGVHVCANTEWPILLSLDLNIISFDAHGFFDRFITCKKEIIDYLRRGGIIAWGGVPTGSEELIRGENAASLTELWEKHMDGLVGDGFDKRALLKQCLITPSCGTGSLSLDLARTVLSLTRQVSDNLRQRHLAD